MPDLDLPLLPLPTLADATDAAAPRLLIIYTGGTVGMAVNRSGELVPMQFGRLDRKMPELTRLPFRLALLSLPAPIDSSNVTPADWLFLAQLIGRHYADFDGFVVLHGTDTMAYSAAALSYMLEHLGKPVVFTGAQVPVGRQPLRCPAQPHHGPGNSRRPPPPRPHRARARGGRVFQRRAHSRHAGQKGGKPAVCRLQKRKLPAPGPRRHQPGIRRQKHPPAARRPPQGARPLETGVAVLRLFPGITRGRGGGRAGRARPARLRARNLRLGQCAHRAVVSATAWPRPASAACGC